MCVRECRTKAGWTNVFLCFCWERLLVCFPLVRCCFGTLTHSHSCIANVYDLHFYSVLYGLRLGVVAMDNNTITGTDGNLCAAPKEAFIADCGGNFPELQCACCTKCCYDGSVDCTADVAIPLLDENYKKHYFDDEETVIVSDVRPAKI